VRFDLTNPYERLTALQIIDVNVNRASEGMRVVEEYCRFVLANARLTMRCKSLRDRLHESLSPISRAERLLARDTLNDVGASGDFGLEIRPEVSIFSLEQIAIQNSERVKEALRAIEEYGKAISAPTARSIGDLRYQWYTLERDCSLAAQVRPALSKARLYVLIDGGRSPEAFAEQATALIEAGVHAIQLRDKQLDDAALLDRVTLLRQLIARSKRRPLLIVNDRPGVAVQAEADGVHMGQEDLDGLGVGGLRQIVGPQMIVGISTHTVEQARQATVDGANYIGCGPTFPSETKHFEHFAGPDLLRSVAAEIPIPAFAIGGITLANLPQVLAAGFTRVAVSAAITAAEHPAAAAIAFLTALNCDSKDET